jgi:hypothetical protein
MLRSLILRLPFQRRTNSPVPITLILGCARSGTSILGELIASHPQVLYTFESAIWEKAVKSPQASHRLSAADVDERVRRQIARYFARKMRRHGRPGMVLLEKNPRNCLRVPFLHALFPQAKFIHIVRDGRDVACSLLPGIGGEEWSHLKPPNWQELLQNYQGIQRCGMTWKTVVELALADLQSVPHLQVRYEDLVSRPVETAQSIFDFMGLEPHPDTLAFASRIQDKTEDSYHAGKQEMWYRDDHQRRIGRWRQNLSPADQDSLQQMLEPLLRRLNYV